MNAETIFVIAFLVAFCYCLFLREKNAAQEQMIRAQQDYVDALLVQKAQYEEAIELYKKSENELDRIISASDSLVVIERRKL